MTEKKCEHENIECYDCDAESNEIRQVIVQAERERLRQELHKTDWIKLVYTAIQNRKTSWSEKCQFCDRYIGYRIVEWRNATDEICHALLRELEKRGFIEPLFKELRRKIGEK